jgi:hypothetical protein
MARDTGRETDEMRVSRGRLIVVGTAMAVGSLFFGGSASAQPVETGSLSFTSDPGDYIGGGQSYSYDTTAGDTLSVTGSDDNTVEIGVTGGNGDWWNLTLAAPRGETLTAKTYTGATRAPFRAPGEPGIDLWGNGRGCNEDTGSFTVDRIEFGPNSYVTAFDATYEQHCEGGTAALRGEVHITNPPPPPPLDLGLNVAVDGTASTLNGNGTVHGTVTCTKDATVNLSGTLVETKHRVLIRGPYSAQVDCTAGTPAAWTATVVPSGSTPFQKREAEADTSANGWDDDYGKNVTVNDTSVVTLQKA